jgi:hypothetical protein
MIVFDLLCGSGHRFEGWFASGGDFADQQARGLVSCPACGASKVERVPSATRFNAGAEEPGPAPAPDPKARDRFAIAQVLYSRMLDELLEKSEDVGEQFPAEARRIHYREAPERAIRGKATEKERQELVEEGIPVLRLPVPPPEQMN